MDHFGDGSRFGVKMHYFVEREPLGSAGGIKQFEAQLDPLFFFLYGDVISLVDYGAMAVAYAEKNNPIGMVARSSGADDPEKIDVVELDAAGRFVAVHCKPHAEFERFRLQNSYKMRGSFILDGKSSPISP